MPDPRECSDARTTDPFQPKMVMDSLNFTIVSSAIFLTASCTSIYQKADIARVASNRSIDIANHKNLVIQYRVSGLQQIMIYLSPREGVLSQKNSSKEFSQSELSKLRVKATSLGGRLDVNGIVIDKGVTVLVDLTKIFNDEGKMGSVRNLGKYNPIIRVVSCNDLPADENLCDLILTVEDPEGITRSIGLRVHGGFTDSL